MLSNQKWHYRLDSMFGIADWIATFLRGKVTRKQEFITLIFGFRAGDVPHI